MEKDVCFERFSTHEGLLTKLEPIPIAAGTFDRFNK